MKVQRKSVLDGKIYEMDIDITDKEWELYTQNNQLIQHAFPHLSQDEREFLISGITPQKWQEVFGDPNQFVKPSHMGGYE